MSNPIFNFLGTLTDSDLNQLSNWLDSNYDNLVNYSYHFRIRAAQLRRTSGILEKYYNRKNITSTFVKDIYHPPLGGPSLLPLKDDIEPAKLTASIKQEFQDQIASYDDALFKINMLRKMIEDCEDKAQNANDAPQKVKDAVTNLYRLFDLPQYRDVLIRSTDTYNNSLRFRTDSLADRTPYEQGLSQDLSRSN